MKFMLKFILKIILKIFKYLIYFIAFGALLSVLVAAPIIPLAGTATLLYFFPVFIVAFIVYKISKHFHDK